MSKRNEKGGKFPTGEERELIRTGTTAASLQQAILDNLYYIQGRTPRTCRTQRLVYGRGLHGPRPDAGPFYPCAPRPVASRTSATSLSGGNWMRWIDTSLESPGDICAWDEAEAVRGAMYAVQPRSVAVLVGRMKNEVNM